MINYSEASYAIFMLSLGEGLKKVNGIFHQGLGSAHLIGVNGSLLFLF